MHGNFALNAKQEIDLRLYEKRFISENGEDGILQKIFSVIGSTSQYYLEFEAGNGHFQSNTKYLKRKYEWKGLLLDQSHKNPAINLHKETITSENICIILKKYNVPHEFDLAVIKLNGNEFYVWKALNALYKPRVVLIRFNQDFNYDEDKVLVYNASCRDQCPAASMLALYYLGKHLNYSLIYQESNGINLFFIRNDVLESTNITFKNTNEVSKLYTGTSRPVDTRMFTSSLLILAHDT